MRRRRRASGGLPLIQYWHAERPPDPIADLLASFPLHSPGLRQLVFNEASAEGLIAACLSGRELEAFRACAVPASQADYLRYCAGYALGGFCLDADVLCGGDLSEIVEHQPSGILFGRRNPQPEWIERAFAWPYIVGDYRTVVNGVFYFARPGHPLLGLALEVATANIESRVAEGSTAVWLTTGPGIFTSIYLLERIGSIDGFLRYASGTVLASTARLFCDVVGNVAGVQAAFDGVEVVAIEDLDETLLRHAGVPRAEAGGGHWAKPEGSIFRS